MTGGAGTGAGGPPLDPVLLLDDPLLDEEDEVEDELDDDPLLLPELDPELDPLSPPELLLDPFDDQPPDELQPPVEDQPELLDP